MFSEGESELRDLIVQNLETCGFLSKIKAELRAGVFLALEEDNLRSKVPLFNEKFDKFLETPDGKLIISIIREFLDYFKLHFTLSVFDPEVSSPCLKRAELCNQLNIKETELEGPVISALLKTEPSPKNERAKSSTENHFSSTPPTLNFANKSLETISEDLYDKDKYDSQKHSSVKNGSHSIFSASKLNLNEEDTVAVETLKPKVSDSSKKPIDKLRKELAPELKAKEKDPFPKPTLEEDSIFRNKVNSTPVHHDPFFDEPFPSEKGSYFGMATSESLKDPPPEKGGLSSLKDLPSLTTKDWTFSLPTLEKSAAPVVSKGLKLDSSIDEEESSEKQVNSEGGSVVEEIEEEEFSAGLEDLLNSSSSLGEDATSEQTLSQASMVDGVVYMEPAH